MPGRPLIGLTLDCEEPGHYSNMPWYAIRQKLHVRHCRRGRTSGGHRSRNRSCSGLCQGSRRGGGHGRRLRYRSVAVRGGDAPRVGDHQGQTHPVRMGHHRGRPAARPPGLRDMRRTATAQRGAWRHSDPAHSGLRSGLSRPRTGGAAYPGRTYRGREREHPPARYRRHRGTSGQQRPSPGGGRRGRWCGGQRGGARRRHRGYRARGIPFLPGCPVASRIRHIKGATGTSSGPSWKPAAGDGRTRFQAHRPCRCCFAPRSGNA